MLLTPDLQMNEKDISTECQGEGEHRLSVTEYHPKSKGDQRPYNNLYVTGFKDIEDFNKDDLTKLFEHFGELLSVSVPLN